MCYVRPATAASIQPAQHLGNATAAIHRGIYLAVLSARQQSCHVCNCGMKLPAIIWDQRATERFQT